MLRRALLTVHTRSLARTHARTPVHTLAKRFKGQNEDEPSNSSNNNNKPSPRQRQENSSAAPGSSGRQHIQDRTKKTRTAEAFWSARIYPFEMSVAIGGKLCVNNLHRAPSPLPPLVLCCSATGKVTSSVLEVAPTVRLLFVTLDITEPNELGRSFWTSRETGWAERRGGEGRGRERK